MVDGKFVFGRLNLLMVEQEKVRKTLVSFLRRQDVVAGSVLRFKVSNLLCVQLGDSIHACLWMSKAYT